MDRHKEVNDRGRGCPVETTLSVIGGKWKGPIILNLATKTIRYNELQRRLSDITPRVLTKQLRELENDGILHREVYQELRPRVEYSLTEFGRTLIPVLTQLAEWDNQFTYPFETTLSVIEGKWKGMILFQLSLGTIRYNELQRQIPKVTPRILVNQLRELEEHGIIHRETYDEIPPKVEYTLTDLGHTLKTVLAQMEEWGNQFLLNILEEGSLETVSSKRVTLIRQGFLDPDNNHGRLVQSVLEQTSRV